MLQMDTSQAICISKSNCSLQGISKLRQNFTIQFVDSDCD